MRWTLEEARSMLHVRAAFQSDQRHAFLDRRMEHEVTHAHRHLDSLEEYLAMARACWPAGC